MDSKVQSQIRGAFDAIKEESLSLRTSTVTQRKKKLRKLHDWILKNRAAIQEALHADLNKPRQESDLTEILMVLSEIRKVNSSLKRWMKPKKEETSLTYLGTSAKTYYEPKGACLIIAPWNYPFQLAVGPLISAIAAGNSVIVKPSEFSEHTSLLIQKMCEELFHPSEVSVVLGAVEETQELLSLPFDHIFFTGSPKVGKIIMEAASRHLSSVTLELGGKSPTIIDESATLKDAASKIAWGKWQNAGQICVAPDFLFVHESKYDEFLEYLTLAVTKFYEPPNDYARIISREHHNRINDLMADAIELGADIYFGGKSDRKNLKFSPTALTNVSKETRIMEEEIFGPILPVLKYSDLTEVVDYINQKPKPLALYLFSNKRKNIDRIKKETSSGMFTINDVVLQFTHPHLPIGGVNNSGIGKAHGHYGFLAFSNEKAVLQQRVGFTMAKTIYPPYSKMKNFIIDLMVKYF
ncbi:MAG: aldehyde dehydrogenase family protein [Bacteroidota bacterium]